MLNGNWADLLFARKCSIFALARPRTPRQPGTSSVSFYPDWPNTRPGEGATTCRIIFSKCFVVFSTCRIVFRKCLLASPKQPADCFRRLNTLKLKPLGRPFSGAKGRADSREERGMHRAAGGRCRRGGRKRTAGRTKEAAGQQKSRRGRRKRARGQRKGQREQRKSRQVRAKRSAGRTKESAGAAKETARGSENDRGDSETAGRQQELSPSERRKR